MKFLGVYFSFKKKKKTYIICSQFEKNANQLISYINQLTEPSICSKLHRALQTGFRGLLLNTNPAPNPNITCWRESLFNANSLWYTLTTNSATLRSAEYQWHDRNSWYFSMSLFRLFMCCSPLNCVQIASNQLAN